jgi:hypothetical protein
VSATTVSLPMLDLDGLDFGALTMATEDQRWRMVERVMADNGVDPATLPAAWHERGPLSAWCWLVLVVNGLDLDDDDPRPLVHWGIDLGFSSTAVRRWVWCLA